jgi:peptidoglycan-associated lipoprotein
VTGCPSKPARPDPSQTAMGMGVGPAPVQQVQPPSQIGSFGMGETPIEQRSNGFDANNQNRTLLADDTVYFDFDSPAIKASERPKLKTVKEYLDKNPTQRLILEGHCDWRGTPEYNLSLGDRRAAAVKKYLTTIGVPADRMETLSKGALDAAKNADEATMTKDRRVDMIVANPKPMGGGL